MYQDPEYGGSTARKDMVFRIVPKPPEDPSNRQLKVRFIKRPSDQRIVKCEVFDADTREVVGQLFVSDVTLKYEANGSHPEALVRLISAWEDAYE